ncbi:MAG: S-layer homology domain-containing protein, partial [Clostridia bacterium]|nr:S-layer homology domain-containing protein [Clostridia bacterium]
MKKRIISILLMLVTVISSVTVTAFTVSASDISNEGILPFKDVKESDWFADEAEFCYVNKIINGMDEHTFAPNTKLTRAQFVMMLANVEGVDTDEYEVNCFNDVKAGHWHYGAVAWAYSTGIVSGTSETEFSPNRAIDRMSLSRMLSLYMISKGYEVEVREDALDSYTDADSIPEWALDGVKYLISAGIMSGMTETTVGPRISVTRAQAARFLTVYTTDYRYGGCEHIYTEAGCVTPPQCEKCGLVTALPLGHIAGYLCCTQGNPCERCGEQVPPQPGQHKIVEATCTVPEHCMHCGEVTGPVAEHRFAGSSYCQTC